MTTGSNTAKRSVQVAIIGAGFGGLGCGIRLRQNGRDDFVIFERAAGIGGTWWANRYPGCACDVPSRLYSYSFFPNPDWTRRFAPRAEIQAYLERAARHFDITARLRLGCGVRQASFDEARACWHLVDDHEREWTARYLVTALGGLSRPHIPDIPGLDQFAGRLVHSSRWPDDLDVAGRRVAVIGTGASGAQIVPEVAPRAAHLDVYQRTPHWILPRPDAAIGPAVRAFYRRVPAAQKLARLATWLISEARVPGLAWSTRLAAGHRLLAHWHRCAQLRDTALAAALRPDYDIGCKRVILSSDFYPTLARNDVTLVDRPITRVTPETIVDADGKSRPCDLIVLATGFRATDPVPEGLIIGRGGCDLAQTWAGGPQAWRGVLVHGFPNLVMLMGPNTALGHNSVIVMIEAQIEFALRAIAAAEARGGRFEIGADAQRDYNAWLQRRLARTVWNSGGCSSWYLHPESRRNTTLWPGFTWQYRRLLRSEFETRLVTPATS